MKGTEWITEMMMEMVLVLVMTVMYRPPPTPRRRGDDDGDDFPPLRSPEATGSDPLQRESGAPSSPRPQIIRGKLGRPFSAKMKVSVKSPTRGGAQGAFWWVPRCQVHGPRGPTPFGPCGPPAFDLLSSTLLLMKNWRGIFPLII